MIEITNEDWGVYLKQFGPLMVYIGNHISGDAVLCDRDTNMQDLTVAALNSVTGYYRKNALTLEDISVQDVIQSDRFKPWTKTILWNAKCKKGSAITKRKALTTSSTSISDEKTLQIGDGGRSEGYNGCADLLISKCMEISPELIREMCDSPGQLEDCLLFED